MNKNIEQTTMELDLLAVDLRRLATELESLSKSVKKLDKKEADNGIQDNRSKLIDISKGVRYQLKELCRKSKKTFKQLITKQEEESN